MTYFLYGLGLITVGFLVFKAYQLGKHDGIVNRDFDEMIGQFREMRQLRQANQDLFELNQKILKDNAAVINEFYGSNLEVYRG